MPFKPYREESRKNYGTAVAEGAAISLEQLQVGALMRIADATENMAQRHTELISQRDYWEREARDLRKECARLRRSNSALRGVVKRLKRVP